MTTTEAMDTALLRSLGLSWEAAEIVLARINELKSDLEAAESRAAKAEAEVERLKQSRSSLARPEDVAAIIERAEKAEAACAEMRSVLLDSRKEHFGHRVSNGWFIARDRALMSDCGRGWLSPEKRREALECVSQFQLTGGPAYLSNAAAILKEDE